MEGGDMRADDLRLEELVDFSEGVVSLHGRRLVLHDMRAFAQFRRELIESAGLDRARGILTRFGYFCGQADAAAMRRIFEWKDARELLKASAVLLTLQGLARARIRLVRLDFEERRFELELSMRGSAEAEEHVAEFGTTDHAVCWITSGYASGYFSFCLGEKVYFIEERCVAKGDSLCVAVGKDAPSWGPQLTNYLGYFTADDIMGKVKELSDELRRKNRELAHQKSLLRKLSPPPAAGSFHEVRSPAFAKVVEMAARVARFDTSVLITGESGTGKEVLARHVHTLSDRSSKPFVAINCGALPESLLEGELFGHAAGAFTGAARERTGLLEQAQGGTVFLDEIGDVPTSTQVKLLRVLQEREVLRLGENRPRRIDVRIIAATNRDLRADVASERFREDLFYRLAVVEIEIPPLRERRDDILPLARLFIEKFAKRLNIKGLKMHAVCANHLLSYSWPGNVRELENTIKRAAVFSDNGVITPECLSSKIIANPAAAPSIAAGATRMADVEQSHIRAVLAMCDGNKSHAAKTLGISQATLWRKLKSWPST